MFWYYWPYMNAIGKKLQNNEKLKRWLTNLNFDGTYELRSALTSQTRPPMTHLMKQKRNSKDEKDL